MRRLFFLLFLVAFAAGCASGGGYAPMGYLLIEECGFRYCYSPYYDATASRTPARAAVLTVQRHQEPILVEFRNRGAMGSENLSGSYASSSASVERMSVSQSAPRPEPVVVSPRDPH